MADYADYYKKRERGFHPRAINSNGSWTLTNPLSFMNAPLLTYHRGNTASADPIHSWRKGPLMLFQRNCLRGRSRAERTHDYQGRESR
jgi:hypothetical protein